MSKLQVWCLDQSCFVAWINRWTLKWRRSYTTVLIWWGRSWEGTERKLKIEKEKELAEYESKGKWQILHHIRASLIHYIMSIAAVMQLFTCPFDNDTSHAQLYLTLGMQLCRMTHICFHRNRRFQCGLCNWIWWICPFLDNRVVQLWGHQRALTPSWPRLHPPVDAAGWAALPDFFTSFSLPLALPHLFICFVYTCVFCVRLAQVPKPWGSNLAAWVLSFTSRCQTSPPLPALLIQPTASYSNLSPHRRGSPASLLSSPLHCAQQQSWCISKHFI